MPGAKSGLEDYFMAQEAGDGVITRMIGGKSEEAMAALHIGEHDMMTPARIRGQGVPIKGEGVSQNILTFLAHGSGLYLHAEAIRCLLCFFCHP